MLIISKKHHSPASDYIFAICMKAKKIITAFLILVMVLQFLPVRQAIRYFFFDNLMVEEVVELNKNSKKFLNLFEEDQDITDGNICVHHYVFVKKLLPFHFAEVLPATHAADVHTPPPNTFFI